jgi:hypothetical protein
MFSGVDSIFSKAGATNVEDHGFQSRCDEGIKSRVSTREDGLPKSNYRALTGNAMKDISSRKQGKFRVRSLSQRDNID